MNMLAVTAYFVVITMTYHGVIEDICMLNFCCVPTTGT